MIRIRTHVLVSCFVWLLSLGAHAEGLNVNQATREQLEALPGIGQKLAQDIVREREENGPYASLDAVATRVPTVTPQVLQKLRGQMVAQAEASAVVHQEGRTVTNDVVQSVLMRFAGEPSVRELQALAIEYANVHPEIVDSLRTRSRLAGLAPRLILQGRGTSVNATRTVENLDATAAVIEANNLDNRAAVTVGTRWDLDQLIFNRQELGVARETVRLANLRDRVLEDVTRRYYERRRLQVDLELNPPTDLGERVRKELRLQELTADLDGYTGGAFSEKLKAAGRSPY